MLERLRIYLPIVLLAAAGAGLFWLSRRPHSVPADLREACRQLRSGDRIEHILRSMPAAAYRPGCCDPAAVACGDRLLCHHLESPAGQLRYNCDEEGSIRPLLWRADAVQCSVLFDLEQGRIVDVELAELPL